MSAHVVQVDVCGGLEVSVGGRRIDIRKTARQGRLTLAYLALRAGQPVTRANLMEHVWEGDSDSYSNIVDVYASRLRRKIDEDEDVALFKTLRGTGYMLEAPPAAARHARAASRSRR